MGGLRLAVWMSPDTFRGKSFSAASGIPASLPLLAVNVIADHLIRMSVLTIGFESGIALMGSAYGFLQ